MIGKITKGKSFTSLCEYILQKEQIINSANAYVADFSFSFGERLLSEKQGLLQGPVEDMGSSSSKQER